MSMWWRKEEKKVHLPVKTSSKVITKPNGHSKDKDLDEEVEDDTEEELKKKVKELEEALIKLKEEKDMYLEALRKQVLSNTTFLQDVIVKLIERPSPSVTERLRSYGTMSAKDIKKEEKADSLAGPVGKLP